MFFRCYTIDHAYSTFFRYCNFHRLSCDNWYWKFCKSSRLSTCIIHSCNFSIRIIETFTYIIYISTSYSIIFCFCTCGDSWFRFCLWLWFCKTFKSIIKILYNFVNTFVPYLLYHLNSWIRFYLAIYCSD